MRGTSALYVRQLLAKLQPSFPASQKESSQLLNILESSFKKHLDEVYPGPRNRPNAESLHQNVPLASKDSASTATDRYLNSVLTHPLLEKRTGPDHTPGTQAQRAVQRFQLIEVEGLISFGRVLGCMKEYCAASTVQKVTTPGEKLAPMLAAWLYSAPADVKEAFFLMRNMLQCALTVIANDKEEVILWEWLRMVYERDFGLSADSACDLQDARWLQVEDELVAALMRFSIRRKDLGDAAQQFVSACRYRKDSGRAAVSPNDVTSGMACIPMCASWNRLAASIIHLRNKHGISASLFDELVSYSPTWFHKTIFGEPLLSIYHPSSPSAQLLCMTFRNAASSAMFAERNEKFSEPMRKAIVTTFLDGAQLSLSQGLKNDAEFLLNFTQGQYPEYFPLQISKHSPTIEDQLQSMWKRIRGEERRHSFSLDWT